MDNKELTKLIMDIMSSTAAEFPTSYQKACRAASTRIEAVLNHHRPTFGKTEMTTNPDGSIGKWTER